MNNSLQAWPAKTAPSPPCKAGLESQHKLVSVPLHRDHYSVHQCAPLDQICSDMPLDNRTEAEETFRKAQYLELSQQYKTSTAWLAVIPDLAAGQAAILT